MSGAWLYANSFYLGGLLQLSAIIQSTSPFVKIRFAIHLKLVSATKCSLVVFKCVLLKHCHVFCAEPCNPPAFATVKIFLNCRLDGSILLCKQT